MRDLGVLAMGAAALLVLGCHTMKFEVQKPNGPSGLERVQDRNHFFLWGLVPTKIEDARQRCPNGVEAIREQTGFLDGLAQLFTIGIWAPRSTTYYCMKGSP